MANWTLTSAGEDPNENDKKSSKPPPPVSSPVSSTAGLKETGSSLPPLIPSPVRAIEASTGKGDLVCDFDKNPTALYKLLESSKWDDASERTRSHPNEVKTWIVRHDKHQKLIWRILPLHAAILFQSPQSVLSALVEKYPKACSFGDDRGMLPLHLAFRQKQKNETVLETLLIHYPKGVLTTDKRGRVPLEYCRDDVFSSRLMRLYADASVAAAKAPAVVGSRVVNGESSHMMSEDYEKRLTDLKASYEERMKFVAEQHEHVVEELQKENEAIKQQMDEQAAAKEETQEDTPVVSDVDTSQEVLDELRSNLESSEADNASVRVLLEESKGYNDDLTTRIKEIVKDHKNLQAMLTEQQEELEAAQAMRNQLIKTLLQQEEEDGVSVEEKGNKLVALADKIGVEIGKVLDRAKPTEPPVSQGESEQRPEESNHHREHNHHDDISAITDSFA